MLYRSYHELYRLKPETLNPEPSYRDNRKEHGDFCLALRGLPEKLPTSCRGPSEMPYTRFRVKGLGLKVLGLRISG